MANSKKSRISLFILSAVLTFGIVGVPVVHGDKYDDAMNALKAQNAATQNSISALANQASDYQSTITQLNGQIAAVEAALAASQAHQADIENQIAANEAKIAQNKQILGDDLKQGYVQGQISTVEMLATSHNLSDYVDKQEYRATVQTKLQSILTDIQNLEAQLQKQHAEVVSLIADQKTQQSQLDGARAQQAQLLAYNQQQQDAFTAQVKANNAQIAQLRSQQAAENARLFAGSKSIVTGGTCDTSKGDTYPAKWCAIGQDTVIDAWGMYNRECVSYTAWKVYESGRNMPYWGGRGNANEWDDNARAAGIPVDTNPRAGDVAIKNSQPYGHAMYVESVNSDGTINISQYNADYQGHFSKVYGMNPAGLVFIHFP